MEMTLALGAIWVSLVYFALLGLLIFEITLLRQALGIGQ